MFVHGFDIYLLGLPEATTEIFYDTGAHTLLTFYILNRTCSAYWRNQTRPGSQVSSLRTEIQRARLETVSGKSLLWP